MVLYVTAVIAAGALALITALPGSIPLAAGLLLAAMVIVSLLKLRMPVGGGHATMTMAYVIDLATIVTLGVEVAMPIAAAGVLVQCLANVKRPQPWYRTVFSVAVIVLSVRMTGLVWSALGGVAGEPELPLPLVGAMLAYFLINTLLVAIAVALHSGQSPVRCWSRSFIGAAPGYLVAAFAVALGSWSFADSAGFAVAAITTPAVACHLAYALWYDRRPGDRTL